MRPSSRKRVHKGHSAKKFRNQTLSSKAVNLRQAPMRGGWRL